MSVRRIHETDVTKAFRELEKAGILKPYSKYELTAEISRITGVNLDPKNTDDWNRDIYNNCIRYMRNAILNTFLMKQFGTDDPETIIKNKLKTTQEFENAMSQITDEMRAPYNPQSKYYVEEKARGIKKVMDQLEPWDLSKEEAEALMIRLQNLNYLWDECLESCEKVDGIIFLSGKFTRGSGYDIPEYFQILGNLEGFVKTRSKQIITVLVQYIAMGGTDSTALLEGKKPLTAIEYQESVPLIISDGPKIINCPMGCGAKFATEEDLRNHLLSSGARCNT